MERLRGLGYSDKDISVMMKDKEKAHKFATDTGTHVTEGAVRAAPSVAESARLSLR